MSQAPVLISLCSEFVIVRDISSASQVVRGMLETEATLYVWQAEEGGWLLSSDPKVFTQQMQDRLLAMKLQRDFTVTSDKESVQLAELGGLEDATPYDECVVCLERSATAGFVHGDRQGSFQFHEQDSESL